MSAEEDDRLSELLLDVLGSEPLDPELIARFDEDPDTLSALERAEVEAWLAEGPANADALAAMSAIAGQDLLGLGGPGVNASPKVIALDEARQARGRWLRRGAAPLALLAAAAAAALLYLPLRERGEQTERGPQMAEQSAPTPPSERPTPTIPAAPTTAEPETQVAESTAPVPAPESTETVDPGAPAPMPHEFAQTTPEPDPDPAPSEPQAAPAEALELGEPVQLAMTMPTYVAPPGDPMSRMMGSMRAEGDLAPPVALSPAHYGLSSSATPTLHYVLPTLPAPGVELRLTIASEADDDPLVDAPLARPEEAGLQAVALSDHAALDPGKDYVWSITLRVDPDRPSQDLVSFGWIRFVPLGDAQQEARADAAAGSRPALAAEQGYFYDAHAELVALERAHPANESIRAARRRLLEQTGLADAG